MVLVKRNQHWRQMRLHPTRVKVSRAHMRGDVSGSISELQNSIQGVQSEVKSSRDDTNTHLEGTTLQSTLTHAAVHPISPAPDLTQNSESFQLNTEAHHTKDTDMEVDEVPEHGPLCVVFKVNDVHGRRLAAAHVLGGKMKKHFKATLLNISDEGVCYI
eukprot:GHVR01060087.1.p4 GENE.GHVR01060087.1~~GHVR01060087.1.p4  ORF type:complete len:159 (-),score=16.55 GHVR01060087.1:1813-2289(-)